MIKGHTEIQLRDAKSGRIVQCTHDDNMVTNGLASFMKNHGMLNDTPFSSAVDTDLITTLLGGILLFDDRLPESENTIALPDGIKMTANASWGVTHTGDPTELGSYDESESGWQDAAKTTFRLVFNWTESQGNGVIKSAALTSRAHGFVGEGNSQSESKTSSQNNNNETFGNWKEVGSRKASFDEIIFAVKDNVAYSLKLNTSAQTLKIYKHSVNDTVCDIRNVTMLTNMEFEEVATLSNPSSNVNFDTYSGVSVRFITDAVVMALKSNNGVIVLTLSDDMTSVTDYAEITAAATGLVWNGNDQYFLTKDGDYLIVYNMTARKMYKIEVDNPTNISEVPILGSPSFGTVLREFLSVGKRHYASNYVYDETHNKVFPTNNATVLHQILSGDLYKDDSTLIGYMSSYTSGRGVFGRNNMYLATVNNLQNSVTKDSTQTMKVIYTLTFS